MRLTLTAAERTALAEFGITEDAGGVLRGEDGGEVAAGTAVLLLKNGQPRHPETGQFVVHDHLAAYAGPGDFGMPEPVRISEPGQFGRGYLADGHAADSPAVTGDRAAMPMPESHPTEPQDFTRGPLTGVHQADPPGSDRTGAEGMAGDVPAAARLAAATERLAQNHDQVVHERLHGSVLPAHPPAPSRHVVLPDMRADSVPGQTAHRLTQRAPGE